MKILHSGNALGTLINQRLAQIGASNIPTSARELIEVEINKAVAVLVQRRISGPVVGRAVAKALVASAATQQEGCKGDAQSPLPSRCSGPKAQNIVAGPVSDNQGATANQ